MFKLMLLGFLAEDPSTGYDLRRRIQELHGFARPVSDGSIYPAIKGLLRDGLVTQEAGVARTGAPKAVLTITKAGRGALGDLLRDAHGVDVTDQARFFVILAFLYLLPQQEACAVLRRRLEFLDQPASFFYVGGRPLRRAEVDDPYRRGMLTIAAASSRAERAWLREVLGEAA